MFGKNAVSDKELSQSVNTRLSRTGTGSKVSAAVRLGTVTLTGEMQYAGQRIPIVKAASRVAGVRQVVDQMVVAPAKK